MVMPRFDRGRDALCRWPLRCLTRAADHARRPSTDSSATTCSTFPQSSTKTNFISPQLPSFGARDFTCRMFAVSLEEKIMSPRSHVTKAVLASVLVVGSVVSLPTAAQSRHYYGPGATMPAPQMRPYAPVQPSYQRAPQPAPMPFHDPTQGWVYRSLAPLEPYARAGERFGQGAMRCGIGGAALAYTGPVGAGVGCVAGAMMR